MPNEAAGSCYPLIPPAASSPRLVGHWTQVSQSEGHFARPHHSRQSQGDRPPLPAQEEQGTMPGQGQAHVCPPSLPPQLTGHCMLGENLGEGWGLLLASHGLTALLGASSKDLRSTLQKVLRAWQRVVRAELSCARSCAGVRISPAPAPGCSASHRASCSYIHHPPLS